ncbi:hypothetical protein GGD55_002678 [Rhizobium giardinii]|uniref:Uncharacterized protein n=1 Tax=Rhizobium giardinii TaxID=56731 RepID=A0A7W8UC01_9HYPH|nr:hypothetical protein [Rhizobium giardinii]
MLARAAFVGPQPPRMSPQSVRSRSSCPKNDLTTIGLNIETVGNSIAVFDRPGIVRLYNRPLVD